VPRFTSPDVARRSIKIVFVDGDPESVIDGDTLVVVVAPNGMFFKIVARLLTAARRHQPSHQ